MVKLQETLVKFTQVKFTQISLFRPNSWSICIICISDYSLYIYISLSPSSFDFLIRTVFIYENDEEEEDEAILRFTFFW